MTEFPKNKKIYLEYGNSHTVAFVLGNNTYKVIKKINNETLGRFYFILWQRD